MRGLILASAMIGALGAAPAGHDAAHHAEAPTADPDAARLVTVKEAEESGYEPYKRGTKREVMNAAEIERA
jgi:hypothetical protein